MDRTRASLSKDSTYWVCVKMKGPPQIHRCLTEINIFLGESLSYLRSFEPSSVQCRKKIKPLETMILVYSICTTRCAQCGIPVRFTSQKWGLHHLGRFQHCICFSASRHLPNVVGRYINVHIKIYIYRWSFKTYLFLESGRWWGCNFYEKITLKHRKLRCFMASTCLKPR